MDTPLSRGTCQYILNSKCEKYETKIFIILKIAERTFVLNTHNDHVANIFDYKSIKKIWRNQEKKIYKRKIFYCFCRAVKKKINNFIADFFSWHNFFCASKKKENSSTVYTKIKILRRQHTKYMHKKWLILCPWALLLWFIKETFFNVPWIILSNSFYASFYSIPHNNENKYRGKKAGKFHF